MQALQHSAPGVTVTDAAIEAAALAVEELMSPPPPPPPPPPFLSSLFSTNLSPHDHPMLTRPLPPLQALQHLAPGITVTDDAAAEATLAAELDNLEEPEDPNQTPLEAAEEPAEAAERQEPMSKKEQKRLKRAMAQQKSAALREEDDEEGDSETELEVSSKEAGSMPSLPASGLQDRVQMQSC